MNRNMQIGSRQKSVDQHLLGNSSNRKAIIVSQLKGIKTPGTFVLCAGLRQPEIAQHQKQKSRSLKTKDVTGKIMPPCMAPEEALAQYRDKLTEFEQEEIVSYPEIYFVGSKAKKRHSMIGDLPNDGFDNSQGYYLHVIHDHIAYRYEIIKTIGKGTFGQVVEAYDHKLQKNVALKIVRNKKQFHHQAQKEIRILEHLKRKDNENSVDVVQLIEHFKFRNHTCISFELLGLNLNELLKRKHLFGFSPSQVKKFARSILKALESLQKNRIIHRDLKPDNILLKRSGESGIKIIDFGSSCFEHQLECPYIPALHYRAPEIILGEEYGMPVDMWAFGCIVAELLTGEPLLQGENQMDQLACIIELVGIPPHKKLDSMKRAKRFVKNGHLEYSTVKILHNGSIIYKGGKSACGNLRGPPRSRDLKMALSCVDDPLLIDFILKCLEFDPSLRMTPSEAMQHPWLCKDLLISITGENTPELLKAETNDSETSILTLLPVSATTAKVRSKLEDIIESNSKLPKRNTWLPEIIMGF